MKPRTAVAAIADEDARANYGVWLRFRRRLMAAPTIEAAYVALFRDGVDVPGRSLRLVVMEGVPWPKPTVLHAARRLAGGGSAYDDRIVRARLAQAFGRLIRRADDHGIFVLLSAAMPSRLLTAFPPGVTVTRVTLDDAVMRAQRLPSVIEVGHEAREDA